MPVPDNIFQVQDASIETLSISRSLIVTTGATVDFSQTSVTGIVSASYAISTSYWNSSSIASELNERQYNIATGSTLPVTSSWASNSISSTSASYWNSSSVATRIDTLYTNKQNNLATGSTIPITASWVENIPFQDGRMDTGSSYPITSSWAINAISSSYWNSSSVASELNERQHNIATGSTLPITSSWSENAISAVSASYWNSSSVATRIDTLFSNKQNNLSTGSTIPVTSSWATNAISSTSASYWNSSSVATRIDTLFSNKQNNIATGSTFPITSSWATFTETASITSVSASYISGSITFSGKQSGYFPIWVNDTLSPTSSLQVSASFIVMNQGSGSVVGSYGALASWTVKGSTVSLVAAKNTTINRLSRGIFSCIFTSRPSTSLYVVTTDALTGSGATFKATGSLGVTTDQSINGFTMSFHVPGAVYTDPVTASLVCFFV
jgi:hypothetical protein